MAVIPRPNLVLGSGTREPPFLHALVPTKGGSITGVCRGGCVYGTIMQRAFWENPRTAWRYKRLTGVLSSGTTGHRNFPGITDAPYRHINEFPSKEQRKPRAAYGNKPMVE